MATILPMGQSDSTVSDFSQTNLDHNNNSFEPAQRINLSDYLPKNLESNLSFDKRIMAQLNHFDRILNGMPNFVVQQKIDKLSQDIKEKFSGLKKLNKQLRDNGTGDWYVRLATFLWKLPLRAAQNIINQLYNIVSGILYGLVHPLKGLNNLAKQIVLLIQSLAQPETWSRIGASMLGSGIGQSLVLANPVSISAMIIGSALLVVGLSAGALKAAIYEEGNGVENALGNFTKQMEQILEFFLSGLYMGCIIGAVHKVIDQAHKVHEAQEAQKAQDAQNAYYQKITMEIRIYQAKSLADQFVRNYHLPTYDSVSFNDQGTIIVHWNDPTWFQNNMADLFTGKGVAASGVNFTYDSFTNGSAYSATYSATYA